MKLLGLDTENTIVRIGGLSTALAATGAVLYWLTFTAAPVVAGVAKSGPPPWPSEVEVGNLQLAMNGLKAGQSAAQARFRRQQISDEIIQQKIILRLDLSERDDIQAALKKNPNDRVYQRSLEQNTIDVKNAQDTITSLQKQLGTSGY